MKRATFESAPCPIARSVDVLGDWWNLLILRECLYGNRRFDEFQRWLHIGRNILSRRLRQLVNEGLLEKVPYQHRPLRHEYELTDKGHDAAVVLMAIMAFGQRWYFEPDAEPIRVFDRRTGDRVIPALIDVNTGQLIEPEHLYAGPGPSFPSSPEIRRQRFTEHYGREVQKASDDAAG